MRPPVVLAATTATRPYDRGYDWSYAEEIPPPGSGPTPNIPIIWDGLWLNTGDQDDGLCVVVENVEGWLDSPPVNGNDVQRVISDGGAWGPKVLQQRIITLSGAAAGPRPLLGRLRDQLAQRAAAREPAQLAIGDFDQERVLVAEVRAGTDLLKHRPLGRYGFRWQVTLTAIDPVLYAGAWQAATLSNAAEGEDTGRRYEREYSWRYAVPYLPNSAVLRNGGNHEAPVYALYEGPLSDSAMGVAGGGIILLAPVAEGMQILVSTATLAAETPSGQTRASYILPGSRPMVIPADSSERWFLRATGRGQVSLAWRSAWV